MNTAERWAILGLLHDASEGTPQHVTDPLNKAQEVIAVAEEIKALNPQYAAVAVHKAGTHRVMYELKTD